MTAQLEMRPEQVAYADEVARARHDFAMRTELEPHNGAPNTPAESFEMHKWGARCELATKLYLDPIDWNEFRNGNPDKLAEFKVKDLSIDSKAIRSDNHQLCVQFNDDPSWAYVLVSHERHPTYKLLGWRWGHEVKYRDFIEDLTKGGKRDCYVFPRDMTLRYMSELYLELRKRQQ